MLHRAVFAAVIFIAAAAAQTKEGDVIISVPFEFIVGSQHLQAGRYVLATPLDGIIRISDSQNPSRPLHIPVHSVQGSGKAATGVVFHCYGQACFLSEVWTHGSQIGKQFYESKAEKEINAERINNKPPRNQVAVLQSAQ